MKKAIRIWITALMMLACAYAALAEPIIPKDKFPMFNSKWNLNNTGIYFTDGEYFFVNGSQGKLYRLDDQLQPDREVFDDSVRGISRITYMEEEHMLYFLADRTKSSKEGGLCRVRFRNGVAEGEIECLVKGVIANYAIDENYICYNVDGYKGIYRIDHDGENKHKLSNHQVQKKNPAVRMHIEDGILYYINMNDHFLWSVPVDAQDSEQAKVFIDRPMHYYIVAPYRRENAEAAENIYIYVEYASDTDKLDKAHLAVVDQDGERVRELDHLRDIQARYINYYQGVLYYIDSSKDPQIPCWVRLDETDAGSIDIAGQGDIMAFKASDGTHWEFNNRVGYIHVFDGWLVMAELGDTFKFYNPRTGRTDIYGGAGSDIWFVNLETMTSYRCHKDN